jgi:hypothetical protein
MLLRTIAIAAGLAFAAATIAPAVSSIALAKDHSHSASTDKSGHDGNHHSDKNDKGKDRKDDNKDHKSDRKHH